MDVVSSKPNQAPFTGSLVLVRSTVCAAVLCLLVAQPFAQSQGGVYKTGSVAKGTPWQINNFGSLIWNGIPYNPLGVKIDPDPTTIAKAKEAGIGDVLVDLPASGAGWFEAITALEHSSLRYVIRINSLAPMAHGIAVEPDAYRVTGFKGGQQVTFPLPYASRALLVLAAKRDGTVEDSQLAVVKGGKVTYEVKSGVDSDHVLLVYPEITSGELPDYWQGLDAHRDNLLSTLRHHAPGKGLRGFVNPLGHTVALPGKDVHFVPSDPGFRAEFANLLEERYKTVVELQKAWVLRASNLSAYAPSNPDDPQMATMKNSAPTATFADFARLVPLWSGTRGVSMLWDPDQNRLYACDNKRAMVWRDISDVIMKACHRRFQRITSAIRQVADVPVVQEWEGWSAPYEEEEPPVDGLTMRAGSLTPSVLLDTCSRAASTFLRWKKPGWLFASDVDLTANPQSISRLAGGLDDLAMLGARGFFVRAASTDQFKQIAAEATRRATEPALVDVGAQAIFFPENALNPAAPQHLPGGKWWLPAPMDGNRIDLGKNYYAYRMKEAGKSTLVIWASVPGRTLIHVTNPATVHFTSFDGSDPAPKVTKKGLEVDITNSPMVVTGTDEIPVPDSALTETLSEFEQVMQASQRLHRDIAPQAQLFRDAYEGFERNPGGNFAVMREQYAKAALKVSTYSWIEAESSKDNNFSVASTEPSCSGGFALAARSVLPPEGGFYADFAVPIKTTEEQEVWIAAKIPAEHRNDLTITNRGQVMGIVGEPTSFYGAGFAWYRLGSTKLATGQSKVRLSVASSQGADISVDVIVFAPLGFQPNGVALPPALPFTTPLLKK